MERAGLILAMGQGGRQCWMRKPCWDERGLACSVAAWPGVSGVSWKGTPAAREAAALFWVKPKGQKTFSSGRIGLRISARG